MLMALKFFKVSSGPVQLLRRAMRSKFVAAERVAAKVSFLRGRASRTSPVGLGCVLRLVAARGYSTGIVTSSGLPPDLYPASL